MPYLVLAVLVCSQVVFAATPKGGKTADKAPQETVSTVADEAPASASSTSDFEKGEHVFAKRKGFYFLARVLKTKGEKYRVRYVAFDNSWDEWVERSRLMPLPPPGTDVEARWMDRWMLGKVLEVGDKSLKVRITVYGGGTFDEWVKYANIRYARPLGGIVWMLKGNSWTAVRAVAVRGDGRYDIGSAQDESLAVTGVAEPHVLVTFYMPGDYIQVEWEGDWYGATILEFGKKGYKITYEGYDSSWDEWISPSRMRRPQ